MLSTADLDALAAFLREAEAVVIAGLAAGNLHQPVAELGRLAQVKQGSLDLRQDA